MSVSADLLIDRRRLRRKLTFWRVAAIVLAVAGIAGAAMLARGGDLGSVQADHIAKVRIEGTIMEDEDLLARLEDIRKSPAVKGVILAIDSPGGTTAGGEAIYEAVRAISKEKPVVTQVGTLAASAGYMIASASDHIVARQSSIVGSIGVLVQFPDVTGLMDKLGIKLEEIKSAPLKAEPSPFNPTTEPERAMIRSMIMDSYEWFLGIVQERRSLTREQALALADGSVFTGRQGVDRKLVDELGGEKEAVAWLAGKGVSGQLRVIEWKPRNAGSFFLGSEVGRAIGSMVGLPGAGERLMEETGADRLFLDGLVSLWHP